MAPTAEDIRRQGLEALRKSLGRAGMIRFLQQFERGSGDYSRDRREWVDATSLDAIRKLSRPRRSKKSSGKG